MGFQWKTDNNNDTQRALWTLDGGIDTSKHPQFITTNQTSDESGVTISGQVSVRGRKPRSLVGPVVAVGVPQLLGFYQRQWLIRAIGGAIQRWDGNNWITVLSGLDPIAPITMTSFEYGGKPASLFTNGIDPPVYFDGSVIGELNIANAPKGKYIMTDTVRVFIAKGDILNFSARLAANDWTTTKNSGFIQIFTPQGGDITGLVRALGMRLVFKKDYMGELHGNNLQEYQVIDVSNQVGCYANSTLQEVQGILFWLGYKQIYAFSGGQPVPIGEPIVKFLETIDWSNPSCFATTDGENYLLGLGNVMLSYSPKFKIWRVNRTAELNSYGLLFNNDWYTMTNTGTVYKEEQAGSRLPMTLVSPAFTEGNPEAWKEYYEIHIQAKIYSGTLEIYVSPSSDGNDWVLVDTVMPTLSTVDNPVIVPLDSVPLCHWLRLKLVTTGDSEILSVERYYNLLPADH